MEFLHECALRHAAGVHPDNTLLASIEDCSAFPRSEAWIAQARREALRRAEARQRVRGKRRIVYV